MPYTKRRPPDESAAERADRLHRRELGLLVDAYELVRENYGRTRDEAYEALADRLRRYGQTFNYNGHAWSWSQAEQSVMRQKLMQVHAPYVDKCGHRGRGIA